MTIHVMVVSETMQMLMPAGDTEAHQFGRFDGSPMISAWRPPPVRLVEPDMSTAAKLEGDCIWMANSVPAVSQRAKTVLKPLINGGAEFLEIPIGRESVFAINVTRVIDCVDYTRSEIKRFKSTGEIMRFVRYAFLEERITGVHCFKIVEQPRRFIFVSEDFVRLAQRELSGFCFEDATFAGSLTGRNQV